MGFGGKVQYWVAGVEQRRGKMTMAMASTERCRGELGGSRQKVSWTGELRGVESLLWFAGTLWRGREVDLGGGRQRS